MGYSENFDMVRESSRTSVISSMSVPPTKGKYVSGTIKRGYRGFGKFLLVALTMVLFTGMLSAQTIYYWIGGTNASYGAASSWSLSVGGPAVGTAPSRNSPTIIFVVDGSNLGGGATGAVTITLPSQNMQSGGWRLLNNANVTLSNTGTQNLTLYELIGTELDIKTGSSLNVLGKSIIMRPSTTAQIDGTLILNAGTFTTTNGVATVTGTLTSRGTSLISGTTSSTIFNAG